MSELFVGIDVVKAELVVAIRPTGEAWTASNEATGLRELVARLQTLTPTLVVLEATGGYELAPVAALAAAGLPVVVVNPRQVRDFARARGLTAGRLLPAPNGTSWCLTLRAATADAASWWQIGPETRLPPPHDAWACAAAATAQPVSYSVPISPGSLGVTCWPPAPGRA